MKFCEKSGQFLKEVAEAPLSWANGKQFMHALANKEYSNLAQYIVPYKKLESPYTWFSAFSGIRVLSCLSWRQSMRQ